MERQQMIETIFASLNGVIVDGYDKKVKERINEALLNIESIDNNVIKPKNNDDALKAFISSKEVEGCSAKSMNYYSYTLSKVLQTINKPYFLITTDDIRGYLSLYKESTHVSKVTIDNVRRLISSFFSWLEAEDYIRKSPSRRIHKIKTGTVVKEIYNDETVELIKQNAKSKRDIAIIDFLFSTGIRVGELVKLNIDNIDFENRECIVVGKGNKQRKVYFDAKTKVHIKQYLELRNDNNSALFVSELCPHSRLNISGVEIMLRKIGRKIGMIKVHPHKFRRTLATKAIDKGMPIEQVQHLLGHSKIDTTLEYAMVDDLNVKLSHKKYLE